MQRKIKIFKIMIYLFIFLNLFILISGYYYNDNLVKFNKEGRNKDVDFYIKKKHSILEELNILEKSKQDSLSNLKSLKTNILLLKSDLNKLENNYSATQDDVKVYQDQLKSLQLEKDNLINTRSLLQEQLKQQLIQQQTITKTVSKTTSSSSSTTKTRAS